MAKMRTKEIVAAANDLLCGNELSKEENDKKYLFPESNVIDMSKLYKDGEGAFCPLCRSGGICPACHVGRHRHCGRSAVL